MSDRMLKVKACEHKDRRLVFSSGEDAPGKSLDTCEQCNTCGAVIHDYRHGGGQRSPNYPMVYASPMLEPFLSVCQQLIDVEREARAMSEVLLAAKDMRDHMLVAHPQGECASCALRVKGLSEAIGALEARCRGDGAESSSP